MMDGRRSLQANVSVLAVAIATVLMILGHHDSWQIASEDSLLLGRDLSEQEYASNPSDPGKYRDKGDLDDCSMSFDGGAIPPPCRIPEPSDTATNDHGEYRPEPPSNLLKFDIMVGIRPKKKCISPLLTDLLIHNWNTSSTTLFPPARKRTKYDSGGGGSNSQDGNSHNGSPNRKRRRTMQRTSPGREPSKITRNRMETPYSIRLRPDSEERQLVNGGRIYIMDHTKTHSKVFMKLDTIWFWKVTLSFVVWWSSDNQPVNRSEVLSQIESEMNIRLADMLPAMEQDLQNELNDPKIRLQTADATIAEVGSPSEDSSDSDSEDPNDSPVLVRGSSSRSSQTISAGDWGWREKFGLSLVIFTVTSSAVLMLIASRQKRLREERMLWGNLTSQEGVDDVLKTGWALTDDGHINLYDKSKLGYSDNDSTFLGGFEQKEAVVGTEITITHPETETVRSPSYGQGSSGEFTPTNL